MRPCVAASHGARTFDQAHRPHRSAALPCLPYATYRRGQPLAWAAARQPKVAPARGNRWQDRWPPRGTAVAPLPARGADHDAELQGRQDR
jgi:hypothetical protein